MTILYPQTKSGYIELSGGSTPIGKPIVAWGYQDFAAGDITSTSVTITANENGTGIPFVPINIKSDTAVIVLAENSSKKAYTGTTKINPFSTVVNVASNANDSVTLTKIPNASWGNIRIYYAYTYSSGTPEDYEVPTSTLLNRTVLDELNAQFVNEEEFAAKAVQITGNQLIDGEKYFFERIGSGKDGYFGINRVTNYNVKEVISAGDFVDISSGTYGHGRLIGSNGSIFADFTYSNTAVTLLTDTTSNVKTSFQADTVQIYYNGSSLTVENNFTSDIEFKISVWE